MIIYWLPILGRLALYMGPECWIIAPWLWVTGIHHVWINKRYQPFRQMKKTITCHLRTGFPATICSLYLFHFPRQSQITTVAIKYVCRHTDISYTIYIYMVSETLLDQVIVASHRLCTTLMLHPWWLSQGSNFHQVNNIASKKMLLKLSHGRMCVSKQWICRSRQWLNHCISISRTIYFRTPVLYQYTQKKSSFSGRRPEKTN